jgi:hypothetical protein
LEELRKQIEAEQDTVTKQLVAAQNEAKKQKNDLTKVCLPTYQYICLFISELIFFVSSFAVYLFPI